MNVFFRKNKTIVFVVYFEMKIHVNVNDRFFCFRSQQMSS